MVVVKLLAGKDQHGMLVNRVAKESNLIGCEGGQVDAGHVGGEQRMDLAHADHGLAPGPMNRRHVSRDAPGDQPREIGGQRIWRDEKACAKKEGRPGGRPQNSPRSRVMTNPLA